MFNILLDFTSWMTHKLLKLRKSQTKLMIPHPINLFTLPPSALSKMHHLLSVAEASEWWMTKLVHHSFLSILTSHIQLTSRSFWYQPHNTAGIYIILSNTTEPPKEKQHSRYYHPSPVFISTKWVLSIHHLFFKGLHSITTLYPIFFPIV